MALNEAQNFVSSLTEKWREPLSGYIMLVSALFHSKKGYLKTRFAE